jgi:hypothetical protein
MRFLETSRLLPTGALKSIADHAGTASSRVRLGLHSVWLDAFSSPLVGGRPLTTLLKNIADHAGTAPSQSRLGRNSARRGDFHLIPAARFSTAPSRTQRVSRLGKWLMLPSRARQQAVLVLAAVAVAVALPAGAVIVDRIVISAGTRVITESEVELRLRLSAFQNGVKPALTLEARRTAAARLLDQKLVEREMDLGHYPRLSDDGRKELLQAYAEQYFQGDEGALGRALANEGLTVGDLEDDLARQDDLLTFLNLRFRPAVQVSDGDVQTYFRTKTNGQIPLNEMRAQIEKLLTNERADVELDAWLKEQRKRTKIEYLDKELTP